MALPTLIIEFAGCVMRMAKTFVRAAMISSLAIAPLAASGGTAQAAVRHVIRIGQIFRNGPYAAKVTGFKCGIASVGSGYLSRRATGQFCWVSFIFENESKIPQVGPGDYMAKDNRGLTYASDQMADMLGNHISTNVYVNPRYGEAEKAFFDVPKHDSLKFFLFSYQVGYPATVVTL